MISPGQRAFLQKLALLLLVFWPAVPCGVYVANFAVDILVADDWSRASLLLKRDAGALALADLVAPTPNGDRPLLPRALMLNLYTSTGGNLLAEIGVTFAAVCVASLCLCWLVWRTVQSAAARVVTGLAINLALFSPVAYENLLWATRMGAVLPVAFFALALTTLYSNLSAANKTALCLACAVAASLCAATGLAAWPALLFAGWCGVGGFSRRARLVFLGCLGVLGGITYALYIPGSGLFVSGRLESLFACLGSPFARFFAADARIVATVLGRLVLVTFALALVLFGRRWLADRTRKALGAWLAIGWFGALSAAAVIFSPTVADATAAVLPRHITTSMLLPVALIGVGGTVHSRWAEADRQSRHPVGARLAVAAVAGGIALAIFWPGWVHGSRKMEQWKNARLQARATLIYSNHHSIEHLDRLDPDPIRFATALPYLRAKGLIRPAPLDAFDFGDFVLDPKRMAPSDFEDARIRDASFEGGVLYARGHAALPGSLRAAHGILVTWRRDEAEPWKPFAFAEPRGQSVAERLFADTNYGMGPNLSRPKQFAKWMVRKPWADAPAGGFELGAWMLDAEAMRAYPLDGSVRLGEEAEEGGGEL